MHKSGKRNHATEKTWKTLSYAMQVKYKVVEVSFIPQVKFARFTEMVDSIKHF